MFEAQPHTAPQCQVEYWELDEDPESDLLFGYGVWPVAQTLSRLLIDATFSDDLQPFHPIPSVRGKSVLELGVLVAVNQRRTCEFTFSKT